MEKKPLSLPKFNVSEYIEDKITQINFNLKKHRLDSVVFGLSGGLDSAIVLALLVKASKEKDSPIKNILPISATFENCYGATDQNASRNFAKLVNDTFLPNQPLKCIDLSKAYAEMVKASGKVDDDVNAWHNGQMLSVLRTPLFYYETAILQSAGFNSVVFGTCNKSEYELGYWGKTSDMAVDFQPIIDLHKSYAFLVAKELGVPSDIINRSPKGDVYDNRTDEQMIGGSYLLIDNLLMFKETNPQFDFSLSYLDGHDVRLIEEHIRKNYHKFQVGKPCHMLDLKWINYISE